jgi:hypothetical protein
MHTTGGGVEEKHAHSLLRLQALEIFRVVLVIDCATSKAISENRQAALSRRRAGTCLANKVKIRKIFEYTKSFLTYVQCVWVGWGGDVTLGTGMNKKRTLYVMMNIQYTHTHTPTLGEV